MIVNVAPESSLWHRAAAEPAGRPVLPEVGLSSRPFGRWVFDASHVTRALPGSAWAELLLDRANDPRYGAGAACGVSLPGCPECAVVPAGEVRHDLWPWRHERKHLHALRAECGPGHGRGRRVAAWGRRAHRLEPDRATAPIVAWMFAERLAGHSVARVTRALNDAGIPCPSAADPKRNPHRTGAAWTLATVASILASPRYMGRQVWNRHSHRQRTDADLVDPGQHRAGP